MEEDCFKLFNNNNCEIINPFMHMFTYVFILTGALVERWEAMIGVGGTVTTDVQVEPTTSNVDTLRSSIPTANDLSGKLSSVCKEGDRSDDRASSATSNIPFIANICNGGDGIKGTRQQQQQLSVANSSQKPAAGNIAGNLTACVSARAILLPGAHPVSNIVQVEVVVTGSMLINITTIVIAPVSTKKKNLDLEKHIKYKSVEFFIYIRLRSI